jgi:cupin fold WbuC family metalloprotein
MERPTTDRASLLDTRRLDDLSDAARISERRRAHLLLHSGHQDQVQRLVIAVEPGTYVRAHQHSEQWEMLVLLRGRVDVLLLGDGSELQQRAALSTAAPLIQIPMGQCHCAIALESGSIVMEIKPGPYRPNEFMAWAPAEGASTAGAFLNWAAGAEVGKSWPGTGTSG